MEASALLVSLFFNSYRKLTVLHKKHLYLYKRLHITFQCNYLSINNLKTKVMEKKKQTSGIATSMSLEGLIRVDAHKAPEHPETLGELGLMNLELSDQLMIQEELITKLYKVLHKLKAPGIAEEVSTLPLQESEGCRIGELKVIYTILRNNNIHLNEIYCKLKDII